MRKFVRGWTSLACASFIVATALPLSAQADASPQQAPQQDAAAQALREEINRVKRELEERLAALEARLATLERGGTTASPVTGTPAATAQVPAGAEGAGGPS